MLPGTVGMDISPRSVAASFGRCAVHDLQLWSDAHFEKDETVDENASRCRTESDYRNTQQRSLESSMLRCVCRYDYLDEKQGWKLGYDYTVFDKWVQFMMDLGINKMINCYSLLTWNNQLHYNDAEKGELVTVELKAQSKEYAELWTPFLKDSHAASSRQRMVEKTNIAMDEFAPEDMEAALKVLNSSAPELGVSLADNHKSYRRYPWIKRYQRGSRQYSTQRRNRRKKSQRINHHLLCVVPTNSPTCLPFSASAESVYAAWHAVAADFDGFLRWAYNSWVENPLTDLRVQNLAGRRYVYRLSRCTALSASNAWWKVFRMRKKSPYWCKKYAEENTPESLAKLNRLEEAIAYFIYPRNPSDDWQNKLNEAKKLLNEI